MNQYCLFALSVIWESSDKELIIRGYIVYSDCMVARLKCMNHSFTACDDTNKSDAVTNTAPN